MDFADRLEEIGKKVDQWQDTLHTEEASKMAVVVPFIRALGYDPNNPEEVLPEFTADVGKKKVDKVDYAIMMDGEPAMLIECKWIKEELLEDSTAYQDAWKQLYLYFDATKAKFGILTNGRIYKFFTDLEAPGKMDEKPFFVFDLLDIKEPHVEELKKFRKSSFDLEEVLSKASELKYAGEVKQIMASELEEPSDELTKFFAKQFYPGRLGSKRKEHFREIVKDALNQYINELMSERLNAALARQNNQEKQPEGESPEQVEEKSQITDSADGIETTPEEIGGFFLVRSILSGYVDNNRIYYQDFKNHFTIQLDGSRKKVICRFCFNSSQKYIDILTKNDDTEKYPIEDVDDILNYKEQLKEALVRLQR